MRPHMVHHVLRALRQGHSGSVKFAKRESYLCGSMSRSRYPSWAAEEEELKKASMSSDTAFPAVRRLSVGDR